VIGQHQGDSPLDWILWVDRNHLAVRSLKHTHEMGHVRDVSRLRRFGAIVSGLGGYGGCSFGRGRGSFALSEDNRGIDPGGGEMRIGAKAGGLQFCLDALHDAGSPATSAEPAKQFSNATGRLPAF